MKIKVSETTPLQLNWLVANPGKVSKYMSLADRIHRQSTPDTNGCRIWNGKKNQHGYAVCKVDGKQSRAHRALYFLLNPDADRSLVVMHTCDNPACVNPAHLKLGTVRDNMLDMVNKGRHNGGAPKGNKNAVGNEGWKKGGVTAKYVASKFGDEVDVPDELLGGTNPAAN